MKLVKRIESSSVRGLTRFGCGLALMGLALLCCSVLIPKPLPVILAMSAGHLLGVAAFSCYLLAIVLDLARHEGRLPPEPEPASDAVQGSTKKESP
jgi:hypothetical protein